MTDETLLELVQSVGGLGDENQVVLTNEQLRLLIAMVRNAEREACADECDRLGKLYGEVIITTRCSDSILSTWYSA
jgi:hypothetical protein